MKLSTLVGSAVTALAAVGHVSAAGFGDYSACKTTFVRKEIHDMTQSEWMTYMTTIQKAMVTPYAGNPKITLWERFGQIHNNYQDSIHANSIFVLWHRWFIYYVELQLRSINANFRFPYWATERQWSSVDWSKDGFWGVVGSGTGLGTPIKGGAFSGVKYTVVDDNNAWWLAPFKDSKIKRAYSLDKVKAAKSAADLKWFRHASLDDYNNIYEQCTKLPTNGFHCWANRNEWLHGTFHTIQGVVNNANQDQVGQMGTMFSPLDPLFFIHHANIDRIYDNAQSGWAAAKKSQAWQINGSCPSAKEASDEKKSPNCLTLDTKLPGWSSLSVANVQFSSQLCVKYQAPVHIVSSGSPVHKRDDDDEEETGYGHHTASSAVPSQTNTASTAAPAATETSTATESAPPAYPTGHGGITVVPGGNTTIPAGNTTIPGGNTTIPAGNTTIPAGNTTVPINGTSIYPPGYTPPTYPAAPLPEKWIQMQYSSAPEPVEKYAKAIKASVAAIFNSTVARISAGTPPSGPVKHYTHGIENVVGEAKKIMTAAAETVVSAVGEVEDDAEKWAKKVDELFKSTGATGAKICKKNKRKGSDEL
ncbi:hypothetical protein BDZ88DRAFT_435818 [Geranomyces variabilis]|nr:hypothetical protein BDZ88DRAFT_435818 [Geranomyces variabilis]KAJ3141559.1 hypothetical protein HDU90_005901 [Geranomyces variabilis]